MVRMEDEPMEVVADEVIVRGYAELMDESQRLLQEDSNNIEAVKEVGRIIKTTNELAKKEQTVQQSMLGSNILQQCAQIAIRQTNLLDTNLCAFDPSHFASQLNNCMGDEGELDWVRLGKKVSPLFRRSIAFSYMFGSFRPTELPPKEPKERQPRQRRQAERAQTKQPEKVKTVQATDEENQSAVAHVRNSLKLEMKKRRTKCLNFFEAVLNPHSFALTVENIFNLSFLVRDERAQIKYDEDGMPMIYLVHKEESSKQKNAKKQQCFINITIADWEELVEVFNVREPVIPALP